MEFSVKTNVIRNAGLRIEDIGSDLLRQAAAAGQIRNVLSDAIGNQDGIKNSINSVIVSLGGCSGTLRKMSASLSSIAELYESTERVLSQAKPVGRVSIKDVVSKILGVNGKNGKGWKPADWLGKGGVIGIAGAYSFGKVAGGYSGKYGSVDGQAGIFNASGSASAKYDAKRMGVSGDVEFDLSGAGASGKYSTLGGLYTGSGRVDVGHIAGKGNVSAGLKNEYGAFSPYVSASGEVSAAVLDGSADFKFGNDQFNTHSEVEGGLFKAKAKGETTISAERIAIKGKASAYAAEGSIKGGYTIFGIKVDAKVTGGAGGAGVSAGGEISTSCVKGDIGAGLGLGAEVELSVDWSENKLYQEYRKVSSEMQKGVQKYIVNNSKNLLQGARGFIGI